MMPVRRRWSDHEFTAIVAPFPASSIPPPAAYPDPAYLHVPGRGTALVSDAIDQADAELAFLARLGVKGWSGGGTEIRSA